MFEEYYNLIGQHIIYFLLVEDCYYKFGITKNIYSRLKDHRRSLKFRHVVQLISCPSRNSSLRVEKKFKKHAAAIGILVKKYGQTEIINTDTPDKYVEWFQMEVQAERDELGILAIVDDLPDVVELPRLRLPTIKDILFPKRRQKVIADIVQKIAPVVLPIIQRAVVREVIGEKINLRVMEKKYIRVKRKRTLKDGTVKTYITRASYKVKNGVDDHRKDGNSGRKEKFTPEQKKNILEKLAAGITVKRICEDMNSSYTAVKRCIDKNTALVAEHVPN